MGEFVGLPQQCTAVAILVGNCANQLNALAQGLIRPDLRGEIPRLTLTAVNSCKLARDMLDGVLEQLGEPAKKGGRR